VLKVIWRQTARNDYYELLDYIAERNLAAAARLENAIETRTEMLAEHPFMNRPGREPGTREAIVHPNYIVVYRVTAEVVEILNVVHARQEYP
jgi:toxin ParE1/3/4